MRPIPPSACWTGEESHPSRAARGKRSLQLDFFDPTSVMNTQFHSTIQPVMTDGKKSTGHDDDIGIVKLVVRDRCVRQTHFAPSGPRVCPWRDPKKIAIVPRPLSPCRTTISAFFYLLIILFMINKIDLGETRGECLVRTRP
jgi:hypothetical protein